MQAELAKSHDCKAAGEGLRKMMGCDEPLPEHLQWEFDGIKFERCANFYINEARWLSDAFEIYNWAQKGMLPYPGSFWDQPNKVIEICNYIDFLIGEKARVERQRIRNTPPPKR